MENMKTWVALANLYLMFLEKFMTTSHGNEGECVRLKSKTCPLWCPLCPVLVVFPHILPVYDITMEWFSPSIANFGRVGKQR